MIKNFISLCLILFAGTHSLAGDATLDDSLRSYTFAGLDQDPDSRSPLVGKTFSDLAASKDVKAILVMAHGASCPVVKQNMREIQSLFDRYKSRGVAVVVVNGVIQDQGPEKKRVIHEESQSFGLTEPVYSDASQQLLKGLGLSTVGEFAIIDPKALKVVFRGGISDRVSYDFARPKPKTEWTKNALDDFLAGKKPVPTAPVFGCAITFQK